MYYTDTHTGITLCCYLYIYIYYTNISLYAFIYLMMMNDGFFLNIYIFYFIYIQIFFSVYLPIKQIENKPQLLLFDFVRFFLLNFLILLYLKVISHLVFYLLLLFFYYIILSNLCLAPRHLYVLAKKKNKHTASIKKNVI